MKELMKVFDPWFLITINRLNQERMKEGTYESINTWFLLSSIEELMKSLLSMVSNHDQ